MKQAFQHLRPECTYYDFISNQIKSLIERWNATHTKQTDPKTIGEVCKRIFNYNKWIKVEDIKESFDLGLMGEFGENKGLNDETILRWFKGNSNRQRKKQLDTHSAYEVKPTVIPINQKVKTRQSLIKIFMSFHDEYKKTKIYSQKMDQYIPVFFRWFKKLGLISITENEEQEIYEAEALMLKQATSFLKETKQDANTAKRLFIKSFKVVCDNPGIDIESQLKSLEV